MAHEHHVPIDEALTIHGPHRLAFAPNAYSFSRKREITSDPNFWPNVLEDAGIPTSEVETRRRRTFRTYFELHWGVTLANPLSQQIIDDNVFALTGDWPAYVHRPDTVYSTKKGAEVDSKFFLFNEAPWLYRVAPFALSPHQIPEGCVLRVPLPSGQVRWYQPLLEDGSKAPRPASKADFALVNWSTTWDAIAELVNVFFEPDPGTASVSPTQAEVRMRVEAAACNGFAAFDIVRADAALIEQQYDYLENDKKLASHLSGRADKLLTDTIPEAPIATLPALTFQYRELNSHLPKVENLRRQLADAASDIGYKLFLEPTPVKYVDANGADQDETIAAGKLFKEGQKTVSWVTYQTVTETRRSLFRKRTRSYQVPIEHQKTFTYYERADVDYDPWTEVADAYRRQLYNVYLFRETAQGLMTADGSSIDEIMGQCREDESFRLRCVVGVPFYENTIVGEKLLVGYVLLVRPLPEISPAEFPSISIDEKLTYKFAWEGVALGELAATIPLAPGEERTVTVAVSQRFESSRTVTTSSLSEVTRVDKSDFETVFEKEVRREKESTKSGGGSIGGSYGGFSGSANFSKTTTTRDMSRQLNRSVQRASQELTRRSKEETTISVTEKAETSTSTTTSYKLKNINEGRTLNITFYRLMNNYSSNLFLDDFDFHVEAGREIVMGTGLRQGQTFTRTDLSLLWDHLLVPGVMPIDVSDKQDTFKAALCAALASNMTKEYGEPESVVAAAPIAPGPTLLGAFASDPALTLSAALSEQPPPLSVTTIPILVQESLRRGLVGDHNRTASLNLLSRTFSTPNCEFEKFLNKPFELTSFSYDSGGLHADAQVGLRPATEDYSERMRSLEERAKEADHRLVLARASYLNSRSAKNLISLEQVIDKTKVFVTDRMALYESDNHVYLKLRLSTELLPFEGWVVQIKNGGRYLQHSTPSGGVIEFKLPRLYAQAPWDIGNKGHDWFTDSVSAHHDGTGLKLSYRAPAP